jgi:hypothetical protein
LWLALWPITLFLVLSPIQSRATRAAFLFGVLALWFGLLLFSWRRKPIRILCCGIAIFVLLIFTVPGRVPRKQILLQQYVNSLRSYERTPYVWGGENHLGIDCSGLIRKGMIDANVKNGVVELNPGLLREALALWWFDCSARAMRNGYRNQSELVSKARRINDISQAILQPGDFAVTADGVHVLGYLGKNLWIEADPSKNQVIIVRAPNKESIWFDVPVVIRRWKQLGS